MYLWLSHTLYGPYDLYDSHQDTITIPSKPMDGLYMVRRQDSWCLSNTHMLYGHNCIQLQWTALLLVECIIFD